MHKKFAKDGLVAITLSMDLVRKDVKNPRENALKLLQKHNASLINLIVDDDPELLKEKLQYQGGLPMVYVFNRQGKWKLYELEIDYEEMEKTVERFLKSK